MILCNEEMFRFQNTSIAYIQIEYLQLYGELFQAHLERTVTDHIPRSAWKELDSPDMIPRPDLDTFVFCKVIDPEGILLDDYQGIEIDFSQEEYSREHKNAGDILFVRYQTIREYVQEGKVELIL
jgi:hypothetical protein